MNISCTVREGDNGCYIKSVNLLKTIEKMKQKKQKCKECHKESEDGSMNVYDRRRMWLILNLFVYRSKSLHPPSTIPRLELAQCDSECT